MIATFRGYLKSIVYEKGTLPNVPTEDEVKSNGVNLSEMNTILLQKIEELTLYTIQQQKIIKVMQKEISELKSSINH